MSTITLDWIVSGQHVDATAVVLSDRAITYGIKRNDTDASVVDANAAVSHDGVGLYSYDTSLLDPEIPYTATWKVSTTDWPDQYIDELILPVAPGQCTLADVEREFAMRIGPYERRTINGVGTAKTFVVNKLKSSLDLGGLEDRYILRRGLLTSGLPVPGFNDDDRQRLVVSYTHDDGLIEVDRNYTVNPADGEDIEIHYLDPEFEIRPVVQAALANHVRLVDRATITLTSVLAEQDITVRCPWITEKGQIYELSSAFHNSVFIPFLVDWWSDFLRDGHLWVQMGLVPYPNTLLVEHWRYAATLVNGAYSADGPDDDADILYVNRRYAAAAAHMLSFLYGSVRPRIMDAAQQGLYIDQQMAVQVFEDEARRHFKPKRRRQMIPGRGLDASVLVNGPTLSR